MVKEFEPVVSTRFFARVISNNDSVNEGDYVVKYENCTIIGDDTKKIKFSNCVFCNCKIDLSAKIVFSDCNFNDSTLECDLRTDCVFLRANYFEGCTIDVRKGYLGNIRASKFTNCSLKADSIVLEDHNSLLECTIDADLWIGEYTDIRSGELVSGRVISGIENHCKINMDGIVLSESVLIGDENSFYRPVYLKTSDTAMPAISIKNYFEEGLYLGSCGQQQDLIENRKVIGIDIEVCKNVNEYNEFGTYYMACLKDGTRYRIGDGGINAAPLFPTTISFLPTDA